MATEPLDLEAAGRVLKMKPHPNEFDFQERRRKAVEYRTARLPYDQIALLLAADPDINSRSVATPGGYGWKAYREGTRTPSPREMRRWVMEDIDKGLVEARVLAMESAARCLAEELATCDAVTQAMWKEMMGGSHWHAFRVLQSVEMRAKLQGFLTTQGNPALAAADAVDNTHSLEGPQPDWEAPGFAAQLVNVFRDSGLITDDQSAAANRELDAAHVPFDAEVIEAETVPEPEPEPVDAPA